MLNFTMDKQQSGSSVRKNYENINLIKFLTIWCFEKQENMNIYIM